MSEASKKSKDTLRDEIRGVLRAHREPESAADVDLEIVEKYDGFSPPFDVPSVVRRLLRTVPGQYLGGLKAIVLTNVSALPRRRRRRKSRSRGRVVQPSGAAGFYHREWKGEPAHIVLLVDQICSRWGRRWLRLGITRDSAIARTLFHEIGHHIHTVHAPEHREREDVADEWSEALSKRYLRRRYWYLVPVARLARFVVWITGVERRGERNSRRART